MNRRLIKIASLALPQLAALVFVLGCVCFLISRDTAIGTVRGVVSMQENGRPISGAKVFLIDEFSAFDSRTYRNRPRVVRTNARGEFEFPRVETGVYRLSARAASHSTATVTDRVFSVVEGRTTNALLAAAQAEPVFQLHQAQAMYGTQEHAQLGFTGYVDDKKGKTGDSVSLQVWKLKLSDMLSRENGDELLRKIGRGYEHITWMPASLVNPKSTSRAAHVFEKSLPLQSIDEEGFFHVRFKFDSLRPALYLVQANHAGKSEVTWLLVSDMALVVKRAAEQMTAYTAGLQSGTPITSAEIRTYSNGKVIHSVRSDAFGLATYNISELANKHHKEAEADQDPEEGSASTSNHNLITVAVHGEDESVIQRSYYSQENDGSLALFTYTDRPIYRPGQEIKFREIARTRLPMQSWKNGVRFESARGSAYHVIFRDVNGEKLLDKQGTLNDDGCLWGSVTLDSEAPTGVYSLITTVNGESRTHDITIASYKKPEFAVTVSALKPYYIRGEQIEMAISGQYYFGSPAAGARVKYRVYREEDYTYASDDDDNAEAYAYDAEGGGNSGFYGQEAAKGTGTLDENGKLIIHFPAARPEDDAGPQKERYTASVTVIEGEDNEVTADGKAQVYSGALNVGVTSGGQLATPGKTSTARITVQTLDGQRVANKQVTIEGLRMHWDSEGMKSTPVFTHHAATEADGSVIDNFVPDAPGELQIKVTAADDHGNKVTARTYYWVVANGGGDLDTSYTDLALHADKKQYQPGETARILVNSLEKGMSVLLTIEGDRVHMAKVVPMTAKSTVVDVPISGEYGPNISLAACYIKNKKFATSELNLRVAMPLQQLNVLVTPDKRNCQPGDPVTYTVKTTDDKGHGIPAALSLGVVDESIYAIREDTPKALFDEFYPHRQSQVQTEFSFSIAFMGDADKSEPQMVARKRFPDTAYWNPNLHTNSAGEARITVNVPDTLTTWRTTVVGATEDTRVGRGVCTIVCSKPFMVRLETPRSLVNRDQSRVLTVVHNDTGALQNVHIALDPGIELALGCNRVQTAVIQPGKRAELVWPVDAVTEGRVKITAKAWTDATAPNGKPYMDAVEVTLPVLPHGRTLVNGGSAIVPGGASAAYQELNVNLPSNALKGSGRLEIRVTPSAVGGVLGSMEYLTGFPYGCTEQILSKFVPDLMAARLVRAGVLPHGASLRLPELPAMVKSGIMRINRMQDQKSGTWGWWQHGGDDPWMTAYALLGLAEAAKDNYPVSENVLHNAQKAADEYITKRNLDTNTTAFLLYALARSGSHKLAATIIPKASEKLIGAEGLAWLILTCKECGLPDQRFVDTLMLQAKVQDASIHWARTYMTEWTASDVTTTATALMALTAARPNDPRCEQIMCWLMRNRSGDGSWSNTRDTAWGVMALCAYVSAHHATRTTNGQLTLTVNGQPVNTAGIITNSGMADGEDFVAHVKADALHSGQNTIRLTRPSGGLPAFFTAQVHYLVDAEDMQKIAPVFPSTAHLGAAPAKKGIMAGTTQDPFELSREYRRVAARQSNRGWHIDTEATNDQLNEGDHIRVRITITSPRDMEYVLIEDPYPAGCEISEKGEVDADTDWSFWYSNIDVRDTHVAFFAKHLPAGKSVIEYNLRAKTRGSYHAMPAMIQAMYAPELHAESAENRVMVR